MRPKSYKDIYKELAENLDVKQSFIMHCVDFYYADLRSTLTELEKLRVNAPGLGYFNIKRGTVHRDITKFTNITSSTTTYTMNGYQYHKRLKALLVKLNKVDKLIKEEDKKKLEFKTNKKNVQSKRNLEK
tara:strand:+ start:1635 stop:2024 length:390 start_codon:yes stop_codon:yes gene_type:complete